MGRWKHCSTTPFLQHFKTPTLPCPMPPVTVACHAMATRFEIVLHGDNPAALRAAGEEAMGVVEQLEAPLSLFKDSSESARLNAPAAKEAVRALRWAISL